MLKSGLSFLVLIWGVAFADETLTGGQIKELLVGNTSYGEARKGWQAIRFMDENGSLVQYRVEGGRIAEGTWSIDGNQLCWGFERARTNCGTLVKNGEQYQFLKDGKKHIYTIKKIKPGNAEKM